MSCACMCVRFLKTLGGFRFALNYQHCREAASPFFSAKLLLPTCSVKTECSEGGLARGFPLLGFKSLIPTLKL